MKPEQAIEFLTDAGIKPTPNRQLVVQALAKASAPLSLMELEVQLETMEKSSVFRVLSLLLEHDAVHAMEDGRGIAKYELCHSDSHHSPGHMHAHFYCEECRHTFCLDDVQVPAPKLPQGFVPSSINFMVKGLCADCSRRQR